MYLNQAGSPYSLSSIGGLTYPFTSDESGLGNSSEKYSGYSLGISNPPLALMNLMICSIEPCFLIIFWWWLLHWRAVLGPIFLDIYKCGRFFLFSVMESDSIYPYSSKNKTYFSFSSLVQCFVSSLWRPLLPFFYFLSWGTMTVSDSFLVVPSPAEWEGLVSESKCAALGKPCIYLFLLDLKMFIYF